MNEDDLFKMFNLPDEPVPNRHESFGYVSVGEFTPAAALSPYAVEQDEWGERRGRDLVAKGGPLEHEAVTAEAAADFHAMAFEPSPMLTPGCEDKLRHEYLKDVIQTPEYRALNSGVCLDPVASELAALHLSRGYSQLIKDREDEATAEERRAARPGARPPDPNRAAMKSSLQSMRAASSAVSSASKEVGDYRDTAEACGLGPGENGGKTDPARVAVAFKRVRNNPDLRRIIERAGAFRRLAQSRRRRKLSHGQDETVGVELGGELARLVPSELLSLSGFDDAAELDAARRLCERQSLQRSINASEPVGRGPVVIAIDESGSMRGEKIAAAKGLALTVAWVARKQKRWVALIGFAGGTEGNVLVLPPGRWDEVALFSWLEHFYGGGTTLDVPIKELPFTYWPALIVSGATRGKTDVLIITDAEVDVPDDDAERFNAWRAAEKARVTTLVIGVRPGDMPLVSDECHCVGAVDGADENVARALDI